MCPPPPPRRLSRVIVARAHADDGVRRRRRRRNANFRGFITGQAVMPRLKPSEVIPNQPHLSRLDRCGARTRAQTHAQVDNKNQRSPRSRPKNERLLISSSDCVRVPLLLLLLRPCRDSSLIHNCTFYPSSFADCRLQLSRRFRFSVARLLIKPRLRRRKTTRSIARRLPRRQVVSVSIFFLSFFFRSTRISLHQLPAAFPTESQLYTPVYVNRRVLQLPTVHSGNLLRGRRRETTTTP